MRDRASAIIVLVVALLFCSWSLYTGVREHKTWTWLRRLSAGCGQAHTAPSWNYRVMLMVWAAGAAFSLFALIYIAVKGAS